MFSVVFGVCEIDNFVEGSNLYYHKAPFYLFTCLFFLSFILYMPWKHRRRCSLIILHNGSKSVIIPELFG